ncbi:MAG: GWxTD domain-containing protein [Ignavibacteriales bacterium]|nr:GWxTD domain-containing protein [Ignavibacteriales bacterium]
MRFDRTVLTLLFVAIYSSITFGQHDAPFRSQSPGVLIEVHNFPSHAESKSRLDVLFKIPEDFFIFVKDNSEVSQDQFIAEGEVNIEILSMKGESQAHTRLKKRLTREQSQDPSPKNNVIEGMSTFILPMSEYSIAFEVDDLHSSRKYSKKLSNISLQDFSKEHLSLSNPFFVQSQRLDPGYTLKAFNDGGDVPFGQNFDVYLELAGEVPVESVKVKYFLYRLLQETDERSLVTGDSIRQLSKTGSVSISVKMNNNESSYVIDSTPVASKHPLWLRFKGDTLEQGNYELDVTASSGTDVVMKKEKFSIRWFDMPFSLRSLDMAVDALEYLATEGEMKFLHGADEHTRRQLFEEFWKKRDPTPHTASNEVMTEYYRRVDHAFRAFSTVRDNNGVKTDRGKAYILYGPPAKIDRELTPRTNPREVWSYPSLHQQLVFIDESRVGDDKLAAVQEK